MNTPAALTGRSARTALWFYFAFVVLTCFGVLLTANRADLDLWGRMAVGALWDQTGRFPYHDPFSYTAPGGEWVDHEWGSGVLFYRLFLASGDTALFALKVALLLVTLGIAHAHVLRQFRRQYGLAIPLRAVLVYAAILAMTLGAVPTGFASTTRCQHFSFLFHVAFLGVLETYRGRRSAILPWILPPLMLAWVNLHGGVSYGFLSLAVYLVWLGFDGRRRDAARLLLVALAAFAALFANPYGPRLPVFLLHAWRLPREFILEWWNVFQARGTAYGLIYCGYLLLLLALAARAWRRDPRSFPGVPLLVLVTGVEGIRHVKLMPFFVLTALVFTPAFVPPAPAWRPGLRRKLETLFLRVTPPTLAALAAVACLAVADRRAFAVRVQTRAKPGGLAYPVAAADFLERTATEANIWCPFETGEFLAWRLFPLARVSMDGRYEEVYPPAVVEDYRAFAYDGDIGRALRYPSTHLLLPTAATAMAVRVSRSGRWHTVYEDDAYRLYARHPPAEVTHAAGDDRPRRLDDFRGDLRRFAAPHRPASHATD
jgi:hypothetical protein